MTDAISGSLLGTAVGDALGLPYENLRPGRLIRLLGPPDRYRLFFGRGFVSDDTEHSCIVAQSLIASGGDPDRFEREVAARLRWWLVRLPAGTGMATARAILKSWCGVPPSRSGVFSAGNGPAMRAPLIGAAIDEPARIVALVERSSRITHTDPKATWAAIAVALAARHAREASVVDGAAYRASVDERLGADAAADELRRLLADVAASIAEGESTADFARRTYGERGISGYAYHTVPAAVHAWLAHPDDYAASVSAIISCGGDTDSTAAIVGGIVGARVGRAGIPTHLVDRLAEWPCTVDWMTTLAAATARSVTERVDGARPPRPPRTPAFRQVIRNVAFLLVVLFHGFRRLFPPY